MPCGVPFRSMRLATSFCFKLIGTKHTYDNSDILGEVVPRIPQDVFHSRIAVMERLVILRNRIESDTLGSCSQNNERTNGIPIIHPTTFEYRNL